MLPPPCFTIGIVPSFLQTWRLTFRPNSSVLVSSDRRILFLMVWESLGAFWQTLSGLSCAFYSISVQFTIKAWLVEWCRDGCPSGRYSHLHRGTLELCQSDHQVLGHLPDWGHSPPIALFGRAASSLALSLWGIVCRLLKKSRYRISNVTKCGKSQGVWILSEGIVPYTF